nr:pupal cuticle protein-like [Osmia lignaria]
MRLLLPFSCFLLSVTAIPTYGTYPVGGIYHGPPAPLAQDGRVIDTPEVAHAKAAHLAAHAIEAAKASSLGYSDYPDGKYEEYVSPAQNVYHGPPAPLAHDGRVIDTPEVAHAKAAHLAAHADQLSKIVKQSYGDAYPQVHWSLDRRALSFDRMIRYLVLLFVTLHVVCCAPQWYGGGHPGAYGGHAAPAPLGPDGRVVDTPEVAQLKAAHLAALADANARAPKGLGPAGPYPGPAGSYAPGNYAAHYSGPPAPLGPDGRVVDTPEVQQAKAVHFSLYSAEAQRAPTGPAGPAAPVPHNPSWNSGAYNPSWNENSWNQY